MRPGPKPLAQEAHCRVEEDLEEAEGAHAGENQGNCSGFLGFGI